MSCTTKEPSYTGFTNIKVAVDYIFYQGEGLNVTRVLDLPSYNKILKGKVTTLPHKLMPSDHFSILADFLVY